MINNRYKNKKIVILGLGITGLSCIKFFLRKNISPIVMDNKTSINEIKYHSILNKIDLHLGNFNKKVLKKSDLIIISPGISIKHPDLIEVIEQGIEVISDVEIFCREVINVPVIAITGTNGKSTVIKMLEKIFIDANIPVGIGGNIGYPVLNLLNKNYKVFILELSSFQLESTYSLKTKVSSILNVSEDHMDRYPFGINEYRLIKSKIYKNASICLFNKDDELTLPIFKNKHTKYISFGTKNANYTIQKKNDIIWLQKNGLNILNTKKMQLIGKHNYINALAALAISDVFKISYSKSLKSIINFTSLPHRFEIIHNNNNIIWINDSKATNIGSTIQAINSIETKGNIWLLLGGYGKSANFDLLVPYLEKSNLKIYCFGRDKKILYNLKPKNSIKKNNIREAVKEISLKAKPGDIVLLSPSCASYDQFKNFQERGHYFTNLAKELG